MSGYTLGFPVPYLTHLRWTEASIVGFGKTLDMTYYFGECVI